MTVQNSHKPTVSASSKNAMITVAREMVVATVLAENSAEFSTRACLLKPKGSMSAMPFVRLPIDRPTAM